MPFQADESFEAHDLQIALEFLQAGQEQMLVVAQAVVAAGFLQREDQPVDQADLRQQHEGWNPAVDLGSNVIEQRQRVPVPVEVRGQNVLTLPPARAGCRFQRASARC